MSRRIVFATVLASAFVLMMFGRKLRSPASLADSVTVSINSFTNFLGGRFAEAVITNRGAASIRIWGWASVQGASPANAVSQHEPSEHTRLLSPSASWRVLIPVPTNGTPWCAEFQVSHESWYIGLVQRLRSPRYEWIKLVTGVSEPEVSAEVVHTVVRTD